MRAIFRDYKVLGDKLWDRFNVNDSSKQGWYYRGITDALISRLDPSPELEELDSLVREVFPKK